MDAGGSMEPYADLCSQLFSAANSLSHFRAFKYYYFHNCPYDVLYSDIQQRKGESIEHLIKMLEPDYKVIFVGDACMAYSELMDRFGDLYFHGYQKMPESTGSSSSNPISPTSSGSTRRRPYCAAIPRCRS